MRLRSRLGLRSPKPATPSGPATSQKFSFGPLKSRIAGSTDQARRRAACLSADGTPLRIKALMSLPALIDSIGGRLAASSSGIGDVAAATSGDLTLAAAAGLTACAVFVFFGCDFSSPASRLRRDQRLMKFSGSFIAIPAYQRPSAR